jgi:hypothetical protein
MTDRNRQLQVNVHDGEIVVTLPHTHFAVKYSKLGGINDLQLVAKEFPLQGDPRSEMSQAEFMAHAFKLANDKAHELGWKGGRQMAPKLTAEDGADFTASLEDTPEGPQARFTLTWQVEDEDHVLTETDHRTFSTEAEAIAWLDAQAAKRGFAHYPMTRAMEGSA